MRHLVISVFLYLSQVFRWEEDWGKHRHWFFQLLMWLLTKANTEAGNLWLQCVDICLPNTTLFLKGNLWHLGIAFLSLDQRKSEAAPLLMCNRHWLMPSLQIQCSTSEFWAAQGWVSIPRDSLPSQATLSFSLQCSVSTLRVSIRVTALLSATRWICSVQNSKGRALLQLFKHIPELTFKLLCLQTS